MQKKDKHTFDQMGFIHIPGFLNHTLLKKLKREVDRYIQETVPYLESKDVFYDDPQKPQTLKQLHRMEQDPFFSAYRDHSSWQNTASTLLGEPVTEVQGVEFFNKPPNTRHLTPPHQDNSYFCLEPPSVLTIWVALDPVDEENGCMHYVKESHLYGLRNHECSNTLGFSQFIPDYSQKDKDAEVKIIAAPGDALIHNGNTIHRAEPNLTKNRNRRAFAMVFRGASARRDEVRYQIYQAKSNSQQASLGVGKKS